MDVKFGTDTAAAAGTDSLLAPAENWGALWAVLGAFGPLFITIKLYFESQFPFLGGLFYKTFIYMIQNSQDVKMPKKCHFFLDFDSILLSYIC